MEKKKYRVRKKKQNQTDVQNYTTDSFVGNRVGDVKKLVGSNLMSFKEQQRQNELKSLVDQIPQMMQYGGTPYEQPQDTSYSYGDNTVANIRNANQGIRNSQQGMNNAWGDIQDTLADYSMQQGYLPMAQDGKEIPLLTDDDALNNMSDSAKDSYIIGKYGIDAFERYKANQAPYTGGDNFNNFQSPKLNLNPNINSLSPNQEVGFGIPQGNNLKTELTAEDNAKYNGFIPEYNTPKLNLEIGNNPFGIRNVNPNGPMSGYSAEGTKVQAAIEEAENEAKGTPKTSSEKTKTKQEKVEEALNETPVEKAKARGNTTDYTESGEGSKETSKTESEEESKETSKTEPPRYGTPMGRMKIKGRDASGKRYKIKYNTAGGPMDMYGNPANVVKGYYGTEADRFRQRNQPRGFGRNDIPFESVEDTDARLNRDQGGYDELERYRKIEEDVRQNPPTRPDINDEERDPLMADNMGQGTPVEFQLGGSNNYSFGQGDSGGFDPRFNQSMGDEFKPMTFAQKQAMKNGKFVPKDFSDLTVGDDYAQDPYEINAKTKWKKAGMNANQIADLSLAGVKGITQAINNNRFRKEKENQYAGADAFASIGNASNMNQGRFDSGNMSGGAFSDRTPVQFGQYGGVFQDGGEYELTEEEIQEIINNGGNVEYL